jgi:hypothetical protein
VSTPTKHRWIIPAVVILLAILLIQLAFTAHRNSCTWDEQDHLYAGYMSWKHGDFGLNPEHPPLVKMVAAIPILNMDLKMPAQQDRFFKTEAKTFCSRTTPTPCSSAHAWLPRSSRSC